MTTTTNIILPTIRFLPVTRDIIRHVVGAIERDTDVHLTVADGQEDDYKKEWILRETGNLAANDRLTCIGLKDARQRLLRSVQLESEWILFLSDDDPYSVDFIRTMCSESRTASSDTMAVVPSTYLSYSSAQIHLFRLQNIVEQTQEARLLSLYQQAHLNGILTCAMMRRKSVLEWLDFLSAKAIWPTYADQLLVSHLAMKGDIVASKEESFYAKDQRDWHDPVRAIIKDSGSYGEKHLTLFHEIFWISDLFALLRSNGLEDRALPSLTFRAVALLQGGVAVFENRLRVLGIEQSDYSREAYTVVTKLAALAATLAEKPLDEHLRFFTQVQSIAAELQTMPEGAHTVDALPHREAIECTAGPTDATSPTVSVVIPCYNQAHWVTEALNSVIAQSYQQWECIVVNDGSSDNTSEVVKHFIHNHAGYAIRLLEVKNGGLSSARNRGVEAAQGEYILPLDSDDRIHADYLQRCVDVLKGKSDISFVYCDRQDFGISEQRVHAVDFDFNHLINGNILSYCSMYRKKVWEDAGGYDESLNSYEDWDFWISAAKRGHKGFHIKECLFYYRVKEQSMYTDALKRDGQLKAKIVLNHPELYSPQTVRDAQQVLSDTAHAGRNGSTEPGNAVTEGQLITVTEQVAAADSLPTRVHETNRPMVSVIVPTFNRPDTLVNALRSILDQTYQDFEIIVVNDAGSDVENIVRFLDREGRITYTRHGSNRNLAAARNTGIRIARGKYIAYLDDDDLYHPDHLETLVTYLEKNKSKVAYTDAHRAHQEKQGGRYVMTKRDIPYSVDFDYDRILVQNFVPVLCFMHERACLDAVGLFDESLTTHEDWEMWIRLSRRFQFAHIKKVTCEFTSRTDGSTMSSSQRSDFLRTYAIILKRYKASITEKPDVRAAQERILQQLLGRTVEADLANQHIEAQQISVLLRQVDEHCKMGDCQRAKEALEQALAIRPDDPQLIHALGNIVLRFGDVEGARREFVKATTLHSDYAPAHADLAAVLLHLGRAEEAEISARRALELDSTDVNALKVVAKICLDTERYREAVQFYVTILQHAPNDIETLLLVGNCYAETDRSEDAKSFYRRVLQLDPGNTIASENLTVVSGPTLTDQVNSTGREASERKSVQVSIIIPVFNRLDLTRQCLEAVRRNTPAGQYELIIVDNGSSDGTTEFLCREQDAGRLRVILNPENRGFARACNQGARAAAGPYLLFLNNDTEVQPGWFEPLVAVLDADPKVGAAGSKLLFPNGTIQHVGVIIIDDQKSGKGLVPSHIHYREIVDPSRVNQSMTFQALTAACLLMRRSVFEQTHGFEEDYRNGYEDVDLCFKIQECGWLMVYEPRSVVIHFESQSGIERVSHEKDNFERLKRTWTGRIVPDVVIRADGKPVSSNANRVRRYRSPALASDSAVTGNRMSPARDGELVDRSSNRGAKALPESVALDKVTEALRCAEAYIKNGNLDAADRVLTEAITQIPDNPDLIVALGHVAWKQGDLEKARLQFVRAATLKQDHAQAYAALAILFLQQSRFAEAEEAARTALAIDATEVTALKVVAKICLNTERYQEAVQTYATILQHAPNDIETLILVGNCYAETGRFERARAFYQKVLALDAENQIATDNLAEANRLASAADRAASEPTAPAASEGFASVSIVIVTYNSASTIRACLDSVLSETRPATNLIVVDNLSTDETRSILHEYQDRIATILNSENCGFSFACNQGIRSSAGEYIVLLNPDTIVTPGWVDRLIDHFGPGVGAVGPVSDYAAELQNLDRNLPDGPPRRMGLLEVTDLLSRGNAGKARETKLLTGFCMMVPRRVLDKVGLLDEELFLGNDDLDLSWRLREQGYRLVVATDTFVYHEGQVSFRSESSEKTTRLVRESTDRLYAKLETHYGPGKVPTSMELWGIDWFRPTQMREVPGARCEVLRTSLIILTHNGLEHTKNCLRSIEAHTPEPHELIIVDNASSDGTLDYLREYVATHDNVRIIANRTNRGFAAGNNQGLALARGAYVLLLNNDTIVTDGWLTRMLKIFEAYPDVGIVGPMSNYVSGPQLIRDVSYSRSEGLDVFATEWTNSHDGQSREATRVVGFCLLTRKEVIARIGGLDEQFGSGNFEDDDFCIRAFQVGFRARISLDAFVHHTGSQTFKAAKIDYRHSLARNWELFKTKWGIPTDTPYEKGYRFPPQSAPNVPLSVPLPDVGTDHRCGDDGRWWLEIGDDHGRCKPAVTGETRVSAVIIPNGHGITPLWSSLVQHTNQPLAITIVPSVSNGNAGELPGTSCPDGWQIRTADVPVVRLLNRLFQSAGDESVILLSGEVVVTPGWLKRLLAARDRNPDLAMVGPAMNSGLTPQQVKADYRGIGKALRQFGVRRAHQYGKQLAVTESLAPSCIVFNPAACRSIGPLREDLDLAISLTDYFARIKQAGHTLAVALGAYVHCE